MGSACRMARHRRFVRCVVLACLLQVVASRQVLYPGGPAVTGTTTGEWTDITLVLPEGLEPNGVEVTISAEFSDNGAGLGLDQFGELAVNRGNDATEPGPGEWQQGDSSGVWYISECDFPGGGNWTVRVTAHVMLIVSVPVAGVDYRITASIQNKFCDKYIVMASGAVAALVFCGCLLCLMWLCCREKKGPSAQPHAAPASGVQSTTSQSVSVPISVQPVVNGRPLQPPLPQSTIPIPQPTMVPIQPLTRVFQCPFCDTKNAAPGGYKPNMQIGCCSCRQIFHLP